MAAVAASDGGVPQPAVADKTEAELKCGVAQHEADDAFWQAWYTANTARYTANTCILKRTVDRLLIDN